MLTHNQLAYNCAVQVHWCQNQKQKETWRRRNDRRTKKKKKEYKSTNPKWITKTKTLKNYYDRDLIFHLKVNIFSQHNNSLSIIETEVGVTIWESESLLYTLRLWVSFSSHNVIALCFFFSFPFEQIYLIFPFGSLQFVQSRTHSLVLAPFVHCECFA